MKEIKITESFYQYQFDPDGDRVIGQNIFVLYHENECIVFDAGYERHMRILKDKLEKYTIKNVICTHFHPDHCYGLNELPKQNLIGSKFSIETLDMFDDLENHLLIPDILVEDNMELDFYNHRIKLSVNKGHSNCGLLIDIDDAFLLIGDEYMTTNINQPVLPYVAETVSQHLLSLKRIIKDYKGYTFLPSHGRITKEIMNLNYRARYLEFVQTKNKNISEFYKPGDVHFLVEKWHVLNIRKSV